MPSCLLLCAWSQSVPSVLCKDSLFQAYPRCSLCLWLHSSFLSAEAMSTLSLFFRGEKILGHRAVHSCFSHGELGRSQSWNLGIFGSRTMVSACVAAASLEATLFILMTLTSLTEPQLQQVRMERPRGGLAQGLSSGCCFSSFCVKVSTLYPLGLAMSLWGPQPIFQSFHWPMWVCTTLC